MNRLIRKKFQNDMRGICEKKSSLTSKSDSEKIKPVQLEVFQEFL
jgi:hypothetical protein